jgi:putative ABC transport system permease protein
MLSIRYAPYVVKQVLRHRTRTALTVAGVAIALFMYAVIQSIQTGLRDATRLSKDDVTLVVFRENRYCPATSRLPQHYQPRIERLPGVRSVMPLQIVVSNCRASLDVVTFRGVPPEQFISVRGDRLRVSDGSIDDWLMRQDSALLGDALAARRGFKPGDAFSAAGIQVKVAGIFSSDEVQDRNAAYVHLPFLQYARRGDVGQVTQFNVTVDDNADLDAVARAIDAEFKSDQFPTSTRPEKAFVAGAVGDMSEIIRFTRWVAVGCVLAALGLVSNSIILSAQSRVKEFAVLHTIGYRSGLIARLIIAEGLAMSVAGGLIGVGGAIIFLHSGQFSLSNEGYSVNASAGLDVWLTALGAATAIGVLSGLVPAIQATRREIAESLRIG